MVKEDSPDEIRDKVDHDGLMEELTDEFENGESIFWLRGLESNQNFRFQRATCYLYTTPQ